MKERERERESDPYPPGFLGVECFLLFTWVPLTQLEWWSWFFWVRGVVSHEWKPKSREGKRRWEEWAWSGNQNEDVSAALITPASVALGVWERLLLTKMQNQPPLKPCKGLLHPCSPWVSEKRESQLLFPKSPEVPDFGVSLLLHPGQVPWAAGFYLKSLMAAITAFWWDHIGHRETGASVWPPHHHALWASNMGSLDHTELGGMDGLGARITSLQRWRGAVGPSQG
jgi:hypothetical protein